MKFQTEKKKPTLCIYTDEDYTTEKLEWEIRTLRQELDGTRAALRLQAARCRHLVAAFSTQIQRSEVATRRERELRDEQLSRLLRALLVLDAGLRREQRNIREQLRAKDSVILAQRLEIAMLKGEESVCMDVDDHSRLEYSEDMFGEITRTRTTQEPLNGAAHVNGESNKSDSQLKSVKSVAFTKFNKRSSNQKTAPSNRKILKTSVSFDVLPVRRQEGLEELQRMANGLKEEISGMNDSYMDQEEEMLNRNLYADYQHNPVLECVNQILLRDFEDDEEDKENYQSRHAVGKGREIVEAVNHSKVDENNRKCSRPLKDKAPSPPIKAQHLEEKACLMMTSQRMTLVNVDYEQVEVKKDAADVIHALSQKRSPPPALPPKPKILQLGKKPITSLNKPAASASASAAAPSAGHEFVTPHVEKPAQRKILSNGSLKYPLNPDCNKQELPKSTGKSFEDKLDAMNLTVLHHNTPRGMAVINKPDRVDDKIKVGSSVSFLITSGAGRDSIVSELSKEELPKVSNMVRRFEDLGTSKEGEGDEGDENAEEKLKKAEEQGNERLRENFEEFTLEDVDMTSGDDQVDRPAGDGEETKNLGVSYDCFLEATGLSQKSIITPNRMFNNHRSVVKPKDVKHRSRLLKAAAITNQGGNVVKYWTEPFL